MRIDRLSVKKTFLLSFLLLGLATRTSYGQGQSSALSMPKVIPQSPNAAALGKYGDIPVNTYTGTANIDIPLYTVASGSLQLPLSLSYHTGGIRLNEQAGWTGLGWVLNAGGVITRTVKDKDDFQQGVHLFTSMPELVSKHKIKSAIAVLGYPFPTAIYDNANNAFELSNQLLGNTGYNWEYDMFNYNFSGSSGKFIISRTGQVILEKQDDIHIQFFNYGNSFTIRDANGISYFFTAKELTIDQSSGATYTTSWYLTKMEAFNGDKIEFEYETTQVPQVNTINESGGVSGYNAVSYASSFNNVLILKKITFDNGYVQIQHDQDRQDYTGKKIAAIQVFSGQQTLPIKQFDLIYGYFNQNQPAAPGKQYKRLKLTRLIEKAGSEQKPPHEFFYEETTNLPQLTDIQSYSIDHWGYFNGIANSTLLTEYNGPAWVNRNQESIVSLSGAKRTPDPEKMKLFSLKEVRYPTGGRTTLALEAHEYNITQGNLQEIEIVDRDSTVVYNGRGTVSNQVNLTRAFGTIKATIVFRCSNIDGCQTTRNNYGYGSIYAQVGPVTRDLNGDFLTCNQNSPVCVSDTIELAPGVYNCTGHIGTQVGTDFQEIRINLKWKERRVFQPGSNRFVYAGGLRVKEIKDYDALGNVARYKVYDYRYQEDLNQDGQAETYSHGKLLAPITYWKNQIIAEPTNVTTPPFYYYASFVRYNSSVTQLNTSAGSSVGYDQVSEYWMDRNGSSPLGKTVYVYENKADSVFTYNFPSDLINGMLGGIDNIRQPGLANLSYKRNGNLKKKTEYARNGNNYIPVRETVNEYAYPLVDNYYSLRLESLDYGALGATGTVQTGSVYIAHLYQSLKAERHLLERTEQIVYDQNDPTKSTRTQTIYRYSDKHNQVVESNTLLDQGDRLIEKTTYPLDYGAISSVVAGIKNLQEKHIVSTPIEKITISQRSGATVPSVVGGTLTRYFEDKPYPQQVDLLEGLPIPLTSLQASNQTPGSFTPDARFKQRLVYQDYDSKGNLKQFQKTDDVSTVYLWGYNQRYPIAEVKNATYPEVLSALSMSESQVNALSDETSIRSAMNTLRANLKKAMVTSFTHDPLVGLTSQTGPDGITVFYEYDQLQRLKVIKDQQGNIVKRYQYHYTGQPQPTK
jgi:YD repeat-containing protein